MTFATGHVNVETYASIESKLKLLADETDPQFAVSIVAEFCAAAPAMLSDLRDALARGDAPLACRIAHSLKSNCATFGMLNIAAVLQQVELACKQQKAPPAPAIEAIVASYLAAEQQLSRAVREVLQSV